MTPVLLLDPTGDLAASLEKASEGGFTGDRFWDDSLPTQAPDRAVASLAPAPGSVLVLGPGMSTSQALDLAGAFDRVRPDVCVVLVAKPARSVYEGAFRAGVREVVPPAAGPEDLLAAVNRAAEAAVRRQAALAPAGTDTRQGHVITVISSKGGSGKTTVCSNLAAGLGKAAPGRVAVVDADLQFGDLASAVSLGGQATIWDAARADGNLDHTSLKVFLERHPTGFYLLCAPHFPAEADEVPAAAVGNIIDLLTHEFDYVVVDTAAGLDEHALAAAERSTDLVLVCATDVPSVRGMRKAIEALDLLDLGARRHLVLNRADARVGLARRDIEATIGMLVDVAVPSSRMVPISVNQGAPVVASAPRSPVSKALTELVYRFVTPEAVVTGGGRRGLWVSAARRYA